MATAQPIPTLPAGETSRLLADQWRRLARAATFVAVLTSPAVFVWFREVQGWSTLSSLVATFFAVIAFRGAVDLVFRRAIPWPSLFGSDSRQLREEDVVNRRRVWFWRFWLKVGIWFVIVNTVIWWAHGDGDWLGSAGWLADRSGQIFTSATFWQQVTFVFFLFLANIGILLGPMLLMGVSQ